MTLTQTAILVKQIITASVISVILFIVGIVGYNIWYAYYLSTLPPVEEKPDLKFGVLPAANFPKVDVSSSNYSYSLDTVTGGLPKIGSEAGFEKIQKVYFVTQTFASFLSPQKSEALAEKFSIIEPVDILSETKYKFSSTNQSLTVDLNNGNFSYKKEATISANLQSIEEANYISGFKRVLTFLDAFKKDLEGGKTTVTFLKTESGKLVPTHVQSEIQAAEISLWPAPIDKKNVYTDDFNKSYVTAVVSGSADSLDNYISLNFTYYPVDTTTFATYPVKSSEEAFDNLKTGKAVVILKPDNPRVSITAVSLGYYLARNYSPYLLPIFVFEGPGFVGYVNAVKDQYLSPST